MKNKTEKRKIEMTISANKSVSNSIKAHLLIWKKFHETQKPLLKKLNMRKDNIDLLMHGLMQNARVYQAAASAAELRRTAKAALSNLSDLQNIDDVLGDLQNNWFEVNALVDQISEADFNIDTFMGMEK